MRIGTLAPLCLAALFAACSSSGGAGIGPGGADASDEFSLDAPAESAPDASLDGHGPVDARTDSPSTIDVLPGSGDASTPVFVHTTGGSFAFPNGAAGFVGMNTRGLPHYGTSLLQYATTAQIGTQLDAVQSVGGLVVRVFAAGHDAAASTVAARLGAVLDAAQARGLYVIAALTDFYATGFSPQGDDGAYVSMNGYTILSDSWFAGGYQTNYLPWVDAIVSHYKDHPALFAWELGNELKDNATPANYVSFATTVAQHIRSIDPNHMITTGAISTINASLRSAGDVSSGTLAYQVYSDANLSFLTTHDYDGEVTDDDTDLAGAVSKPIVIEEEGFSTADGNRPSLVLSNGGAWRGKGARGYMQWGFLALTQDNGDGDTTYGMDQVWHQADWSGMVGSYSTLAGQYR